MDNYLYFCTECNKLFKVADTGRKVKCSHCSKPLADLEITDTEYAALDPDKREALKNKARESEKAPEVREPAVQTPEENTGMPETETKAPETETKAPEAEIKTPDVVPPTPANDVKKSEEKPRSSGLFDINALLYGGAGGDTVPETPPVSVPPVDINTAQKAAPKPEPEPSAPPMDINALLKATPEPAISAPSTDINALLKATPEPEPSAPPTDINALLKATPEPEPAPVPAPAPDISADTNTDTETNTNIDSNINTGADTDTDKNIEINTETEADTNTDTDINTDSISAFFDIGDSFKDPYMSEGGSDDEDDNAQENTAEDTAGQDSPIPDSPIPSSPIPDNTISDSMIRSSAMADRIAETGAQLTSEIEKQSDEIIAVRNNYLKIQIQNQLLAVDNFMSICKLSALQDDGVVDKDEEKLLKRLEKATGDYKKALNKLV